MARRSFPLAKVYGLLEPGPVVLLTSAYKDRRNIMTMSWHTMLEFEPPLLACVVSNRNYSFELLRKSKQCVIAIPTVDIADKVVGCGNTSGAETDKFSEFALTPAKAKMLEAPLLAECYANLECHVVDTGMVNKYNLFVLEVVQAWLDRGIKNPGTIHHLGGGNFMVAGEHIKLKSKMK